MLARSASLQNWSQILVVNIKYPVRIDISDLNQCLQIYMNESLSPVENWKVGRAKDTYRGASREIDRAAAKVCITQHLLNVFFIRPESDHWQCLSLTP